MTQDTHIVPFLKMHGLGNDFIIFDARRHALDLTDAQVQRLSNRKRSIGCDQLIIIRESDDATAFMEIRNANGSRVGACGNASRCVGLLLMQQLGESVVTLETDTGILTAEASDYGVSVNMGPARTEWSEIPLEHDCDTLHTDFHMGDLKEPVCVNMGNPHAVFFVPDAEAVDLASIGPKIETHKMFPEGVNVSVATVEGTSIRLRVFERGAGITEACGTAACAAAVAAMRRGLIDNENKATVKLDGGDLQITWLEDGTVEMAGPATLAFGGEVAV
ncbi:diaminopimelate epimerase [Kordiimonas sediminis]|uniref:Diaminopimelate epimerase n=1 Tax=Kordiimonas sediminis TaxID=1735581 RepID=A0A919E4X3_9PROT|nr:diaminopimelate epimerase [Kordiimonas sediminis]GHF19750.1 diaminopimelate epimerase [Kordiimonas sediminis]